MGHVNANQRHPKTVCVMKRHGGTVARGQRGTFDGPIEDQIQYLVRAGWSAPQILKHLERLTNCSNDERPELHGLEIPSKKTIERRIQLYREKMNDDLNDSSSETWAFSTASDPKDARLVLEVLGQIMGSSGATTLQLTANEADTIVRLRTAYPDMPLGWVWDIMEVMVNPKRFHSAPAPIDACLALTPWVSDEHLDRFAYLVYGIPECHTWFANISEVNWRNVIELFRGINGEQQQRSSDD